MQKENDKYHIYVHVFIKKTVLKKKKNQTKNVFMEKSLIPTYLFCAVTDPECVYLLFICPCLTVVCVLVCVY